MEKKVTEIVNAISLAQVLKNDRGMMRRILNGIFTFHDSIPKLEVSFEPLRDKYIVKVKNWIDPIYIDDVYWEFLHKKQRKQIYDRILNVGCIPCEDSGEGPILVFRISKENFQEDHNYNGQKSLYRPNYNCTIPLVDDNKPLFDKLNRGDREISKEILRGILLFDEVMPKLDPSFAVNDDDYLLKLKSWNTEFDVEHMFNVFCHDNRDKRNEAILRVYCVCTNVEFDQPALIVFQIRSSPEYQEAYQKK